MPFWKSLVLMPLNGRGPLNPAFVKEVRQPQKWKGSGSQALKRPFGQIRASVLQEFELAGLRKFLHVSLSFTWRLTFSELFWNRRAHQSWTSA